MSRRQPFSVLHQVCGTPSAGPSTESHESDVFNAEIEQLLDQAADEAHDAIAASEEKEMNREELSAAIPDEVGLVDPLVPSVPCNHSTANAEYVTRSERAAQSWVLDVHAKLEGIWPRTTIDEAWSAAESGMRCIGRWVERNPLTKDMFKHDTAGHLVASYRWNCSFKRRVWLSKVTVRRQNGSESTVTYLQLLLQWLICDDIMNGGCGLGKLLRRAAVLGTNLSVNDILTRRVSLRSASTSHCRGIYLWRVNNKSYIGKTEDEFRHRILAHARSVVKGKGINRHVRAEFSGETTWDTVLTFVLVRMPDSAPGEVFSAIEFFFILSVNTARTSHGLNHNVVDRVSREAALSVFQLESHFKLLSRLHNEDKKGFICSPTTSNDRDRLKYEEMFCKPLQYAITGTQLYRIFAGHRRPHLARRFSLMYPEAYNEGNFSGAVIPKPSGVGYSERKGSVRPGHWTLPDHDRYAAKS